MLHKINSKFECISNKFPPENSLSVVTTVEKMEHKKRHTNPKNNEIQT